MFTALACGGAALWVFAVLFRVSYFGDTLSFTMKDGCFAVFWGGSDRELRNSIVLNQFSWPYLPARGAGCEWTLDRWGRWESCGPGWLLWRDSLAVAALPSLAGMYLPGFSLGPPIGYLGVPLWTVTALGAGGWVAMRRSARRQGPACQACGYDLTGAPSAKCPECGA